MPGSDPRDADLLTAYLQLRSALQPAPDEERLAEAAVHGFLALPGISGCVVCVEGKIFDPSKGNSRLPVPCPFRAEADAVPGACVEGCATHGGADRKRFPLCAGRHDYGFLSFSVTEDAASGRHAPFAELLASDLALLIDHRRKTKSLDEAERALAHSRELTGYVIEHMRSSVAVHDRNLRYLYVSRRYLEEYKVPEKDVIGRHHYDVFPDLPQKWREVHRRALAGEILSAEDDPFLREDGIMYWTRWECRPWYEADGSVGGIIVYTEVINERRRAEVALAEETIRRRILVEQSHDGIVVLDDQGKVYEANRKFAEMLGYSQEEARQLSVWDWEVRHPREQVEEMIRTVDEKGDHFETTHRHKDGSTIDVEISTNAALFGDRKLIFCVCRDISERKRAEKALRESEERLRAIFDSAQEFVYLKDAEMRYTHCNRSMTRFFGLSLEEIIGKTASDLYGEKHGREVDEVDRRVLSGQSVTGSYVRTVRGSERILETSKSPVFDSVGNVVGLCGITRDITEEVRIREQMRQAQKVEAIGRLAGGVAHDLNNMLTPILGYGEILQQQLDTNDARRETVNEIVRAGSRARDLVRQLLAFSRKQTLEFKPVDLNETLRNFGKLLRRTVPEDIEISIVTSPGIRPVLADVGQIEQIIMNLAVNASDAMPDGGRLTIATSPVELDAEAEAARPEAKPGRYVLLSVRDTGCGMDRETRERIFDPFFSTKGERGTGLGLSTVDGIVKQHGGNIRVRSEPARGSDFEIYLPVADGVRVAETPGWNSEAEDASGAETILLVEDNPQVRRLALEILKRQGYEVIEAEHPGKALEELSFRRGPVHLLLTDVVMPGMNGKELYEKALRGHPELKVLYMSGYTEDVIAHRGILDEGIRFLQKPFSVRTLAAKVREVLGRR